MTAAGTLAALLIATLYAPFVHVHLHGDGGALVHAHFPEAAPAEDESVVHMEGFHSHADARSLDLLTTTVVRPVYFVANIVPFTTVSGATVRFHGYVTIAAPVAHGPPNFELRIPRAPPA